MKYTKKDHLCLLSGKKSAFHNYKRSKRNVAILGKKAKQMFLLFRKGNCNLVNVKIKNSLESEGKKRASEWKVQLNTPTTRYRLMVWNYHKKYLLFFKCFMLKGQCKCFIVYFNQASPHQGTACYVCEKHLWKFLSARCYNMKVYSRQQV